LNLFFQARHGIRGRTVTGVQTCALPILAPRRPVVSAVAAGAVLVALALPVLHLHTSESGMNALPNSAPTVGTIHKIQDAFSNGEIGRASCRERVGILRIVEPR